jgi:hypothetical protein
MNKYLFILSALFFISNSNAKYLTPDDVVIEFLEDLNKLKVEDGELLSNQVNNKYKSSYWNDIIIEKQDKKDVIFANSIFVTLKELNEGGLLQSNIDDKFACVFVADKGVIGAFSLVFENGWKLMSPSLYWSNQNIPKTCSALQYELNIKNDALILLKEKQ